MKISYNGTDLEGLFDSLDLIKTKDINKFF